MSVPWAGRAIEEAALLNPAFMGLMVSTAAAGFLEESGQPMPFPLAFVATPLTLHGPTRNIMPTRVSKGLYAWLDENPDVRVRFPEIAASLVDYVREGLAFGFRYQGLSLTPRMELLSTGVHKAGMDRRVVGDTTDDYRACGASARFVGRWLARSGDPFTIMAVLGVRP